MSEIEKFLSLLDEDQPKKYWKAIFTAGVTHEARNKYYSSSFIRQMDKLVTYQEINSKDVDNFFSSLEIKEMLFEHFKNSNEIKNITIEEIALGIRKIFPLKEDSNPVIYELVKQYKEMDLNTSMDYENTKKSINSFIINDYSVMFNNDVPNRVVLNASLDAIQNVLNKNCNDVLGLEELVVRTNIVDKLPVHEYFCISQNEVPVNCLILNNIFTASLKLIVENEQLLKHINGNIDIEQEITENIKDLAFFHKLNIVLPTNQDAPINKMKI